MEGIIQSLHVFVAGARPVMTRTTRSPRADKVGNLVQSEDHLPIDLPLGTFHRFRNPANIQGFILQILVLLRMLRSLRLGHELVGVPHKAEWPKQVKNGGKCFDYGTPTPFSNALDTRFKGTGEVQQPEFLQHIEQQGVSEDICD